MKNDSWEKAKLIFADARKIAPELRQQYLDEVCPNETEIRREVESLLDSFDDAESFMESPAVGEVADVIKGSAEKLKKGVRFKHYEIIEQIGEGGMGEVYLAKDTTLNRKVALKLLAAHILEDETRVSRFHQEALATSALNHPNILTIYEIGEWQGRNFIATEFIDGMTLRSLLQKKKLSIGEALDIALQTASALAAAHSAGIVHRDIKPENIMVREDGLVKVLDFGIAKYRPTEKGQKALIETEIGEIIGTAAYMSPEQARGLEVDSRTDIWSLGVILYETIARKLPFAGKTKSDRIAAILEREPEPLTKIRNEVSPELEQIISRALEKEKEKRYAEVAEMVEDLRHLRGVSGDKSSSPLILPSSRKSQAQRRFFLFAAFAAVLLVFGVIGFVYYFSSAENMPSISQNKKSLAVLPFINAGQDPNAEYLSDGITESIINSLSQISDLKVMSRSSAFRFKNDQTDARAIAAQLGVETLVTGDIRQIGDKFVINVRLIDGTDDSQIWGDQFVKTNADVIAAQNEIAQAVASNLRLKLTGSEELQLAKRYTENSEAYQLYLKGRFHTFKLTPPEIQKGISYFRQAIEIDPNYALAYAGLSDAYRAVALSGAAPPTEIMPRAKAAANKALDIDENLAEAHTSLSSILFWHDWDWTAAKEQIERALEINPKNADARVFYAYLLSNTGRHAQALAEAKRARELDPLSSVINALEGQFLLHAGMPDEALDRLRKTFELNENFGLVHSFASSAYIEKGMFDEAIAAANRAGELVPAGSQPVALLCYALAKSGKQAEARNGLEKLLETSKERYVSPYDIALIYNALEDRQETFAWLGRGFEQRDPRMTFLKVEPKWNNVRAEPRFIELMRRMDFE